MNHISRSAAVLSAVLLSAVPILGAAIAETPALLTPDGGQVRALVIGIDAYQNVRPLKGAAADARDIDAALRNMGVKDLVTLIDAQADRNSVMRGIDQMLQRTTSADLVLLSIAGHGAQEPERVKGSQPDGMDSIFLLPGFDTTPTGSQQRIVGSEFNHFIKQFEARGAHVLFVADTCHGGGMTREVDPRAANLSFRQVPTYTIPVDELKPISTTSDAFLTELDFKNTIFLAAVDRRTKAPEVHIPGISGLRGALSYALARAFEGQADANHDGKVTTGELFAQVRRVVYQLSDQRQNVVTQISPGHDLETDVVFALGERGSSSPAAPLLRQRPQVASSPTLTPALPEPVRIASLGGNPNALAGLAPSTVPFAVVTPDEMPDLMWDSASGDVLAGGDIVARGVGKNELPEIVARTGAVKSLKQLAARAPQGVRVTPNDALHHAGSRVHVEVSDMEGRALILLNIAGDSTVQLLYPEESDPPILAAATYRLPVEVRKPFGADQVVAITADQRMPALEQALKVINQRRSSGELLELLQRYAPANARIGTIGLFTAP